MKTKVDFAAVIRQGEAVGACRAAG